MGCATTMFVITDEMAKPIIDSQIAEIEDSMEAGAPVAVWWCDDERFAKEQGEKEHTTTIAYWIQGYMEQTLVKAKKFDVVTRTQLEKIFTEQKFQYSGRVSDDTMVSIAKILGAKYMVVPRITRISTLNIQVLNSESGKIMYISDSTLKNKQKIGE
jgi:curli biogenesis system outer membrane secretion channel CsgG